MFKHGGYKDRTQGYHSWSAMKYRCENSKSRNFHNYGGRGITVCERWKNSYANFIEDMGVKPSPIHSIERIDNNKGYSPDNCKWATPKEQVRNRRANHLLTYNGETKCITEWAEQYGISKRLLRQRIVEQGRSVEDALTSPIRKY